MTIIFMDMVVLCFRIDEYKPPFAPARQNNYHTLSFPRWYVVDADFLLANNLGLFEVPTFLDTQRVLAVIEVVVATPA